MASKYWIKLYHEVLHDPKMGRLSDRLWRRVMELFLLAGEYDQDGQLPSLFDMAWTLRISEDELSADLAALEKTGIIRQQDGGWFVTNFSKRQAAVPDAERVQRYRKRQRQEQYYGNAPVTNRNTDGNDSVVDTDTDTDTDPDIEEEKSPPATSSPTPEQDPVAIYRIVFGLEPSPEGADYIRENVPITRCSMWHCNLLEWRTKGWDGHNITGQVSRFEKTNGNKATGPPGQSAPIVFEAIATGFVDE
jgi:DNA-binding transcriptional regulator YhcF (GntR family)